MRLIARWFGSLLGIVLILHGWSLSILHAPMISIRESAIGSLPFNIVKALFGESVAWVVCGLAWVAGGVFLLHHLNSARTLTDPKDLKAHPGKRPRRQRKKHRKAKSDPPQERPKA